MESKWNERHIYMTQDLTFRKTVKTIWSNWVCDTMPVKDEVFN